ncbi:enolase C-terminal domain-like protein [Paenibacillus aurantius]|uniref:Enolase C-terminal domain-like protein n=1 Tax=Paenibacillus aurantius TaxID=2918900 RepID=A0AA96LDU8_9BACL|nr:enolase C-terminal domain-like protein [Paenibacillus aurantius]WNQ11374.1 enolase C-terminal domain-like protein [Paenibacillus aurantius]
MITIEKTNLVVEREKLLAPFGFKGGYVDELWQSLVTLEDQVGREGLGCGVQSILWSDPQVYSEWGNERGNVFMNEITRYALTSVKRRPFETPMDLLDPMKEQAYEFASRVWTGKNPLRVTFALNALVPVDQASWMLLSHTKPGARFFDLIPEEYRSGLSWRHERLAATPVVGYGMTIEEITALLDDGYFVLKIKLGSDPNQDGDPDKMMEWDIRRLKEIHRMAGHRSCSHTANGKIAYYLDMNGRYGNKDLLWRLVEAAERMGALEQILLVEEPFPEHLHVDVSDFPVRVAGDERVHSEKDALALIQMGYGAFALKPVAKTMSMSLRVAKLASEHGIPCFCADLTASPIMVDWNKNLAALLPPVPGLSTGLIEANGVQNYAHWEAMKKSHPMPNGSWTDTREGQFYLQPEFYEHNGGVFGRRR